MDLKFYWLGIAFFVSCLVLPSSAMHAQNNYWTQQYSSYAALTGGAAMSNSNENSVFYYNPGAIGYIDTTSINVSANVYAFDRVKLKNGAGNGQDLTSNKVNVYAQVLAGNLYFRKIPKLRLVYGYIMRNNSKFDFEHDLETEGNYIPQAPGTQFFRGKFDYSFTSAEYWGGIGIGYKLNEHISVGLGHYGGFTTIKNLYYQDLTLDAVAPDGTPYVASVRQRFKYKVDHFYILFKPGIDLRFGKHKIGLAAMLPSIRFFGTGKINRSIDVGNLNIYNEDTTFVFATSPNLLVDGDVKNVRTVIKQAPSISLGYEYEAKKWKISCMLEYFFPVKEYDLLYTDSPVYARPSEAYEQNPIKDFLRIKYGSCGVLNFGIGFDKAVSKKYRVLAGFRTDFNNKVPLFRKNYPDYIASINPQFWNLLHFSLGVTIQNENRKTYIGVIYKYGFSNYKRNIANLTNPTTANLLLGSDNNNMQVDIHGVGITLGYSIYSRVERVFRPFKEPRPKRKTKGR